MQNAEINPQSAIRNPQSIESLRYRFYTVEQRIARTLGRGRRFADVRLYVLITEAICRRPWLEAAEEAILGGADCLQLREKSLESGELLRRARQLVELCRRHGVLCIINDRPDIALLSGADGVHVGQDDLPAAEVRRIVGNDLIVGVSTHRIEQARAAVVDGADYIGVGPIFPSSTKPRDFVAGLDYAREVAREIRLPAAAIAGINATNTRQVRETGVKCIAVTAAVVGCDDARAAAAELRRLFGSTDIPVCAAAQPRALPGGTGIPACAAAQPRTLPDAPAVQVYRRNLPHWRMPGATYFVTFRAAAGVFSEAERTLILDNLKAGHGKFYHLLAAVIMPDHVHILLCPDLGADLDRITKGMKGVTARLINQARRTRGSVWQEESWDRIVRDQAELDEKLEYMMNNAAKRELVADPWEYPWWYVDQEQSQ